MDFIANNWYVMLGLLALAFIVGYGVYKFAGLPNKEQTKKIKAWLLYAVTEAEKELGAGTGQIKLRYVWNLFITKFPVAAKIITFEQFSLLVDESLEELRHLLKTNEAVSNIVQNK